LRFTQQELEELPGVISSPRFETYLNVCQNNKTLALQLYQWNLEMSAAFIVPMQVCEVALRNGVVLALEKQYGEKWHLSPGFLKSLPSTKSGYNPSKDFKKTSEALDAKNSLTAGKLVADLKFAFWEYMLTKRHDGRLWKPYFYTSFPHSDSKVPFSIIRGKAKESVGRVRQLRNRIAHHEPIFGRDLLQEYHLICELIGMRNLIAVGWVDKVQKITMLNALKPNLP